MKIQKHQENSAKLLARFAGAGFPPEVVQRIGALALIWGMFETNLESTLYDLREDKLSSVSTRISDLIDVMGSSENKLPPAAQKVFANTGLAAKDLMEYRHAIIHGWLIPAPIGPLFIRNPSWSGKPHKRTSNDAHIDENLLDMAIDSAWIMYQVVIIARKVSSDPNAAQALEAMTSDVTRARSQAGELRHLTALMNHEKN
ncbi:MAG: hypothetical protein WCU88_10100 [Elusimicrobiota bacterium]|jgi:hypothetical protein